jgi:hypothetical protein
MLRNLSTGKFWPIDLSAMMLACLASRTSSILVWAAILWGVTLTVGGLIFTQLINEFDSRTPYQTFSQKVY